MLVEMVIDGFDVPEDGTAQDAVADLLVRVASGDQAAFAALYDTLSSRVFGLILRVLVNRAQSEEVLQEVFLEIWQSASRFAPNRGQGRAWVMTIAHRRAVDRVRASQSSADRDVRAGFKDLGVAHDSVAEQVELGIEGEKVVDALSGLPEVQREALVLAYYGGYSQNEIAVLVGAPLGTIKTRMRDGLTRLRTAMGGDGMNEKDFAELAAGAALHSLSADDERRFRAALAEHPEWQPLVDADDAATALLADTTAPTPPPAHLRSALLAQIAVTPQHDAPAADDATPTSRSVEEPTVVAGPKPRRWARAVFALAACLAVLVGIGIGAVALNQQLNRPASVVALQEIEAAADAEQATVALDDGGTATAHWSASVGKAVLVADGLPSPGDGETYELWFVRGETPVSAGVFDVDGGDATALLAGDMQAGDAIAVTVEQAGGSPTGQPTTDPVIVIPTA